MMNSIGIDKAYDMVERLLKKWPSIRMPENLARQKEKGDPWDIRYVKN